MLQVYNPKNKDLKIYANGQIIHRDEPCISIFDSVVQGGDAVWEGLRLYRFGLIALDRHLDRLRDSAQALLFEGVPTRSLIKQALYDVLSANKMTSGVHIRLTLTRGIKITSGMDPRLNQSGCSLLILPEYKEPVYASNGIRVITSAVRRNSPQYLDSKIHHNNLLNNIQAKLQANRANADAALMLDDRGFAAELHGTNIFCIKDGQVYTPFAHACLPGITRGLVMEIVENNGHLVKEKNLSLTDLYTADEVFTTGTMGELTPVIEIDGRVIINNHSGNIFQQINDWFKKSIPKYCTSLAHLKS